MRLLPSHAGTAPTPRPTRALERWRVVWHGRRDARRPPAGPDQPSPYLESLRAHAEIGQRAVEEWLHAKIDPIDREAIQVLILLEQHQRNPLLPPDTPPSEDAAPAAPAARPGGEDADRPPLSSIPPGVRKAREAAAAHKAYRRWVLEQEEAEQRLGQLGSARHHLIEGARAAAGAHVARYHHLAGLYHTAILRFGGEQLRIGPHPAFTTESWLQGDLPLLSLEIDGRITEKYRWRLKDFAGRTSAVPIPLGDVTPNPN